MVDKNKIVLMYHDVYRESPSESGFQNATAIKYKVDAITFEEQVAAIERYLRQRKLPTDAIDFTFDDGGISFLTVIAPILEKYGFRGKFYISTGYIGCEGFLDANQVKELSIRGHIIGSHSHSHPERMISMSIDDINDEWRMSQKLLTEIIGKTPHYASIPNGYQSKEVLHAMTFAGISTIDTSATTTRSSHFNGAIVRGRYAITDDTRVEDVIRLLTSPTYRLQKSLRWHILSFAKKILGNTYLTIRASLTKRNI